MKRKLVAPLLASGLALVSGACGASKSGPGPGGGDTADAPTASGGTTTSAGGSATASGGSVFVPSDDFGDDGIAPGSGGGPAMVQNGGHRPLTPDEVKALTSAECSQFDAPVEPQAPVIELVVDISQSMRWDVYGCEPEACNCAPGSNTMCADAASGGGGSGGGGSGGGGFGVPPVQCCPDGDRPASVALPTQSKWDQFLPAILSALEGIPDNAAVGMQLFPTKDATMGGIPGGNSACADATGRVAIAPMGPAGSAQRLALADMVSITTGQLKLGTPTHDGLASGQKELAAFTGPGKKFLLLITDGEPTQELGCGASSVPPSGDTRLTAPIISAIEGWAAAGIGTFVVGSPGSEVSQNGDDMRPFLSKAAQVGTTGPMGCMIDTAPYCHFDTTSSPDFAAALKEGLAKITELVNDPCVLQVPDPDSGDELDKEQTSVILNSPTSGATLIQRDDSPADCTQGWTWSGEKTIQLCPASCEQVKADVGAEVNASFGCEIIWT
jgi:hypothetical protein